MAWRTTGVVLAAAGSLPGLLGRYYDDPGLGLLGFVFAVIGLVLIIQGKRVPAALRIELSRHRMLPEAIRTYRQRRLDAPGCAPGPESSED
jgi:hypothetical protein